MKRIIDNYRQALKKTNKKTLFRRTLLFIGVAAPLLMVAVQYAYPTDRLPLHATIAHVSVDGLSIDQAKERIANTYQDLTVPIYFGSQTEAYKAPRFADLGGSIDLAVVDEARYSWWQRLIPTSLWWANRLTSQDAVRVSYDTKTLQSYASTQLGSSCNIAPKNATIREKDGKLVVVQAENGGTCKLEEVIATIGRLTPQAGTRNKVTIAMNEIPPTIRTEKAQELLIAIDRRFPGETTSIRVDTAVVPVDTETILSWFIFSEQEGALVPAVDATKAAEFLTATFAEKVKQDPGTVTITTHDFLEVKREGGGAGRALDVEVSAQNIAAYARGERDAIEIGTKPVEPIKKYIRTYSASNTGLSALMKNYAADHPGVYGVSLIELSGQRRRASYQDARQFTTASTYKLFVAYSTLRRVEAGQLSWDQQVSGGRNLAKCFDDMIVLSDNACAEALVQKIGYRPLTNDAIAIGATRTTFVDLESYKTTAGDLSLLLAQLETGQLPISTASRDRLLGAMKRNVYRRGIPAGATGTVADKVGFLDGLLHDAAIVYSPNGTYVLTILTDGSSWGNIADLTRELEKLRS